MSDIPITERCPECHGMGTLTLVRSVRFGQPLLLPPECKACRGTGRRKDRHEAPLLFDI